MSIEIDATYRSGAIYPNQPLALPENTPVRVVVVEKDAAISTDKPQAVSLKGLTREQIIALRPKAPKFTAEQLDALINKYSVSVGSLPADFDAELEPLLSDGPNLLADFSRGDIYSDHE